METFKAPAGGMVVNRHDAAQPSPGPGPSWTPPAAPAVAPAAPAPAEPRAAEDVLDQLVRVVPGARGAVLASVDGFAVARSSSLPNEAAHAAMLAAALGLAHQLVQMGGGSELRQLVVDHDGGLLLLWPIGPQRVLATLATATVDQRHLRSFVQSHVRWLAGATS